MAKRSLLRIGLAGLCTFLSVATLLAHVTISPKESVIGVTEKYTMRVPNERNASTVRLEAEFPPAANVSYFEIKAGWKIEPKMDAKGKIAGAVWSGGMIGPHEFAEFTFLCRNPSDETKLTWKVIQIYDDGSRSEWTGAEGSRNPSPVTLVKKAASQ